MKKLIAILFTLAPLFAYTQQPFECKVSKQVPIQTSPTGKVVVYVPKKGTVIITSYDGNLKCYKAKYGVYSGCINELWLQGIDDKGMKAYGEKRELARQDSLKQADIRKEQLRVEMLAKERRKADSIKQVAQQDRIKMLVKFYGETNTQRILDHEIWLGMSKYMAKESIGDPDHVNKDIVGNSIHEQWVYGDFKRYKYLYFTDNELTSWQE